MKIGVPRPGHPAKVSRPRGPRSWRWLLAIPTIVIAGPLLLGPLLFNLRSSFETQTVGVATDGGWSLTNYAKILGDPFYFEVLLRTIGIGLATVVVCIGVGFPYAYFVSRRVALRELQIGLLIAPLLVNMVVRVYGWQVVLANSGLINSVLQQLGITTQPIQMLYTEFSIILALVHVLLPYMVLAIYAVLQSIDSTLEDAARSLGASTFSAFWKITVPLSIPGVTSGAILVFTLAAGSFLVPAIMGGGRLSTLPTLVYQYSQVLNWPFASALALVLMAITVPPILMLQRASLETPSAGRT